jgi:hypothetical protein
VARTGRTGRKARAAPVSLFPSVFSSVALSLLLWRTRGAWHRGAGRGSLSYPWRVALPLSLLGGGLLVFVFLLALLACVAWPWLGAGPARVFVFVCCLSVFAVCYQWRGGGGSAGKAKPLSAWPRGSLCCVCVYCLTLFLLSPIIKPPNNRALIAVRP